MLMKYSILTRCSSFRWRNSFWAKRILVNEYRNRTRRVFFIEQFHFSWNKFQWKKINNEPIAADFAERSQLVVFRFRFVVEAEKFLHWPPGIENRFRFVCLQKSSMEMLRVVTSIWRWREFFSLKCSMKKTNRNIVSKSKKTNLVVLKIEFLVIFSRLCLKIFFVVFRCSQTLVSVAKLFFVDEIRGEEKSFFFSTLFVNFLPDLEVVRFFFGDLRSLMKAVAELGFRFHVLEVRVAKR